VVAEVLPVPRHPQRDRDEERAEERSMPLREVERLARPPLAELAKLLARGDFPFRPDDYACGHCPHTLACRYAQPESLARAQAQPERESYFELEDAKP
jgi:hypothetical protein